MRISLRIALLYGALVPNINVIIVNFFAYMIYNGKISVGN